MKRRIFLLIATLLILVGIFILVRVIAGVIAPRGRGALQITTSVKAEAFLSGKSVGQTPVCLCDNKTIPAGDYDLKIIPKESTLAPFTAKITVNPGVLTAVDRTFLPGALSSTYILTLEKTNEPDPSVFISSIPSVALVTLDSQSQGVTPLEMKTISASEHEVEIERIGFAKKTVRIRAVAYYKLVVNVILGTEVTGSEIGETTPSPALTQTISPAPIQPQVKILDTPTGFLRVRATPSVGAAEVGRVNPGESYTFVDENDSWFEIQLTNGTRGWVSKTYATKSTQ